jgi:hypothetical protein
MNAFILFAAATLSSSASAAEPFPIVIDGATCEDQSVPPCDDPASYVSLTLLVEEGGQVEMALDDTLYYGEWSYGVRTLTMDFDETTFRFDLAGHRTGGRCLEGFWDLSGDHIPEPLRFLWNGCF